MIKRIKQHKKKVVLGAATLTLCAVFIPHWEGMDRVAKHNAFDPAGVITVCNGITNYDDPNLKVGDHLTKQECEQRLKNAIPKYAQPLAECMTHFNEYGPHRQVAFISASYNLGPATVCKSTAVRLLNEGDIRGGCAALGNFIKADGKVLKGLVNRRNDPTWGEIAWCLRED
jgi:lysozyme